MAFAIAETALVPLAAGMDGDALPHDRAGLPFTLVGAAVRHGDLADALGLSLGEIPFIDGPVGKARDAFAFDLALDPLARIFIAVGQDVGACAMLEPVLERAFIHAAVIVLLAQHLGILRKRGGQHQRAKGSGEEQGA